MMNNHPIAKNIISKAVLPFVFTMLAVCISSCNKEEQRQYNDEPLSPSGTYKGRLRMCGTGENDGYVLTYWAMRDDSVVVDSISDSLFIIRYRGNRNVEVSATGGFTGNNGFGGYFTGDSLILYDYYDGYCTDTFLGRKE